MISGPDSNQGEKERQNSPKKKTSIMSREVLISHVSWITVSETTAYRWQYA